MEVPGKSEAPKLEVLQVVASTRGGGAVHVLELARGLAERGVVVRSVVGRDRGNVTPESFERLGLPVETLPMERGIASSAMGRLVTLCRGSDLVHVHGSRAAFSTRLAMRLWGPRRPVAYTLHGFSLPYLPAPARRVRLGLERALDSEMDRVIAVCRSERDAAVEAGLIEKDRVALIPNGIDVDRFAATPRVDRSAWCREYGVPEDALVVTAACRLGRPRDFDTLLTAFHELRRERASARLVIAGDGPLRDAVERKLESLSLKAAVLLLGWHDDVHSLYAASDVFVSTTEAWEGLPLAVLEAMASRLPVVATEAGGVPEAVVHEEQGLLVPPRDSAALARALRRLASEPDTRALLGSAAHARVREHFDRARMVDDTLALYRDMLSGP